MELEYHNGIRITKFRHEMTSLEAAIQNYEAMAKEHYAKENDQTLTEQQRKVECDKALKCLQQERTYINTLTDVQAQLEAYRNRGLQATKGSLAERASAISTMSNEKHHPTQVLEKHMRAEGIPKPSPQHTAHHIVPGKGKLKVVTTNTRMHLHRHGIRINDPANGVFLVCKDKDTPHWSMPNSRGHLKYHTHEYEQWMAQRVQRLNNIDMIKTQLQVIGRILQDNEPKTAVQAIKNV
ncbi:AHH domain-containing protein [Microbulbifer hydrolyticus]|uniref:Uncharacterized protein n=1 Tax=Microbulbifer hydrolyticus TaxID=48074 RepID=A0A6P1TDD3_9GAMM|nr:AHH domain-containing protein [Microbulbifer hydrolyticus]MBB5211972.1 hypothetical protein [Microbulbifer hydrolyticus]QHQ39656.1 hypothetical protein GTQ55_12105 [Microbulbifer hydrolyticus]